MACKVECASLLFGMVSGVKGLVMLMDEENSSLTRVTSKSSGCGRMVGTRTGGMVRRSSMGMGEGEESE